MGLGGPAGVPMRLYRPARGCCCHYASGRVVNHYSSAKDKLKTGTWCPMPADSRGARPPCVREARRRRAPGGAYVARGPARRPARSRATCGRRPRNCQQVDRCLGPPHPCEHRGHRLHRPHGWPRSRRPRHFAGSAGCVALTMATVCHYQGCSGIVAGHLHRSHGACHETGFFL